MTTLCLLAALASMTLYGLASVSQAAATRRASGPRAMLHPLYVLGLVADAAAWALSLVALVALPLVVVQPLLAGSVAVAVVLAVPLLGTRLLRQDGIGLAVTTAGLVVVSLSAGVESGAHPPSWFTTALLVTTGVVAALALATYHRGPAPIAATVAGLGFAGAALAGRVVADSADLGSWTGIRELLTDPRAWVVVALGTVGTLMYARALERGGLGVATAVMWVVEAAVPAAVGVAVLGDTVREGWFPAAAAGLVLAVAGCIVLALSPTQSALAEQ